MSVFYIEVNALEYETIITCCLLLAEWYMTFNKRIKTINNDNSISYIRRVKA